MNKNFSGLWVLLGLAIPGLSSAADGFSLRHNLSGSLGPELFNAGNAPGWRAGVTYGYTAIDKVTGDDGEMLRAVAPAGVASLAGLGLPASQYPSYAAQSVGVNSSGTQKIYGIALTHASESVHAGGAVEWSVIIPYGVKTQVVQPVNTIPALVWPVPSALNAGQQAGVAANFAVQYQAGLNQQAAAQTGDTSGLGDVELTLQWVKDTLNSRLIVGAGLIAPTGRYDTGSGPHMSNGNFYTFKPSLIYVRRWGDFSAGVRAALGLNSTNHDNSVRSGNFAGLEVALGTLTQVGSFGLHVIQARQIQNDSGGIWGTNRFASTNAGWSFATRIPTLDWGMSLQQTHTLQSRNAQSGSYMQLKLSKSF